MNDSNRPDPPQQGGKEGGVQDVAPLQAGLAASDPLQPLQHDGMAVREVVQDDGLETGLVQGNEGVAADVAGAAGEQDGARTRGLGHGARLYLREMKDVASPGLK